MGIVRLEAGGIRVILRAADVARVAPAQGKGRERRSKREAKRFA